MNHEILLSAADGVATITLHRPHKKNALTAAMYGAMTQALAQYDADDTVRVVLLRGENDFTAGNDLMDFIRSDIPDFREAPPLAFLRALHAFSKPIVAAVSGVAIGIGTTMLLHTDLAVAGQSARFALPFVRLALVPEAAATFLLPQAAGVMRAKRYLLTGEEFSAQTARELGIIAEVLADAQVYEAAHQQAAGLAALPASAVRETKRLLKLPLSDQIERTMTLEAQSFAACCAGDEFRSAAMKLMQR